MDYQELSNTNEQKIDKLKKTIKGLRKELRELKKYHEKVMKAISCLPFSIDEFLED